MALGIGRTRRLRSWATADFKIFTRAVVEGHDVIDEARGGQGSRVQSALLPRSLYAMFK